MNIQILKLLAKDARMSNADISAVTGIDECEVAKEIAEMKKDGLIRGFKTVIDWEKLDEYYVSAMVAVKVTPKPGFGFEDVAKKINVALEAYPELKSHNEIEDVMYKFYANEINVLICTTIIETGIDIPNTNTLIIEKADRLGLAQMYQIRGRVGRTNRVSYAYFMYDASTLLTQEGKQRLQAIKEFTSLGSGYKIAVRDLVIRGAGDFLGKEQSGYIDAVGMDLYMRLLNDSINEEILL